MLTSTWLRHRTSFLNYRAHLFSPASTSLQYIWRAHSSPSAYHQPSRLVNLFHSQHNLSLLQLKSKKHIHCNTIWYSFFPQLINLPIPANPFKMQYQTLTLAIATVALRASAAPSPNRHLGAECQARRSRKQPPCVLRTVRS